MSVFTDVNPEFGSSNSFLMDEEDTIKNALVSMLTLRETSRFMRPELRSPLHIHLFRTVTLENAKILFIEIDRLIKTREPRVKLNLLQSTIIADPTNKRFVVSLVYNNVRTQKDDSLELQLRSG